MAVDALIVVVCGQNSSQDREGSKAKMIPRIQKIQTIVLDDNISKVVTNKIKKHAVARVVEKAVSIQQLLDKPVSCIRMPNRTTRISTPTQYAFVLLSDRVRDESLPLRVTYHSAFLAIKAAVSRWDWRPIVDSRSRVHNKLWVVVLLIVFLVLVHYCSLSFL